MPQENVDSVRTGYEAFARGDLDAVRDGKAVRLRQFLDRVAALEAVGLSE